MSQESERLCYICLESSSAEQLERENDTVKWVSPCRCTGTMAWVHQDCLVRWIREQERYRVSAALCSQCRTPFILLPEKSSFIIAMDFLYKTVAPTLRIFTGMCICIIAFDSTCGTIGAFALSQVYGMDKVMSMIADEDKMETLAKIHLISYFLFFVNCLPWEDYLLYLLQKLSHVPVLNNFLPRDPPIHFHERPRKQISLINIAGKSVLLPIFSNILGNVFFSSVESDLSRALIGGSVFLLLKGGFYMYLKQKRLVRRTQMQIMPVQPIT